MRCPWLLVACCVAACGSDHALEPAALAERCGAAAPVEILPLAANELVGASFTAHEDRLLVPVLTFDRDIEHTSQWDIDWIVGGRVVSVGHCGEDPRVALDLDAFVMPRLSDGAPWLAQTRTDDVYWIDPRGQLTPQHIARGGVVAEHEGRAYVLVRSSDTATAELARLITDGGTLSLETVVGGLADSSMWTQVIGGFRPGTTLARTPDGTLREVELATGEMTPLVDAVEDYRAAWDSRFVAWRSERDPESGSRFQRAEDGRIVARSSGSGAGLWIFDTPDGPPRRLAVSGEGRIDRVLGQDIWFVSGPGRGDLLRVPLDGAPAETVASDVGALKRLGGDRWATVRAPQGSSIGELVIVGDGEARSIDHDVDGGFTGLNFYTDTDLTPAIFYEVRDHSEDRFGVYVVEVAR